MRYATLVIILLIVLFSLTTRVIVNKYYDIGVIWVHLIAMSQTILLIIYKKENDETRMDDRIR